jgi:hypothetical protein
VRPQSAVFERPRKLRKLQVEFPRQVAFRRPANVGDDLFRPQAEQAIQLAGFDRVFQQVIVLVLANLSQAVAQTLPMLLGLKDRAIELGLKTEMVMQGVRTRNVFERFAVHRLAVSYYGLTPAAFWVVYVSG